ncbi:hypothetical protein C8J32_101917 [Rhizobium sp. PP-CC-3A-592]|nr:hypothetical protein C8J32_101917 [Rhizobium sp. PP-CC-3A-592]
MQNTDIIIESWDGDLAFTTEATASDGRFLSLYAAPLPACVWGRWMYTVDTSEEAGDHELRPIAMEIAYTKEDAFAAAEEAARQWLRPTLRLELVALKGTTMDFNTWKHLSPVQSMAERLGFQALAMCRDWDDYRNRFISANGDAGRMVKATESLWDYLSTGERPVLAAMLHAADFSRLADRFSGDETWTTLDRTEGDHALAVALAVLRR